MMAEHLQTAIYQKLTGVTALMALVVGVYDQPPQEAQEDNPSAALFPYIVIGDDHAQPWDTDTETGFEIIITLHIWTRYAGRVLNKKIQNHIYNALHRQTLSVPGYQTLPPKFLGSDVFLDADGLSQHGVMTFQFLVDTI